MAQFPRQVQPRVKSGGAKSPTIAFRVRGDLYDRLKASAETRGYSLSEEIEHRLNVSMDTATDGFAEIALRMIADNWRAVQSLTKTRMSEDSFALRACAEAAYRAVELLGNINNVPIQHGLLGGLAPNSPNFEAAKQLGHAIVYHRELSYMNNPPKDLVDVYEGNVLDALLRRMNNLQAKTTGLVDPTPEVQGAYLSDGEPGTRLVGAAEAATDFEPAPGQLPASVGDRALFDEARGPLRDGDAIPSDPVAPAPTPSRRRKAKVG